jgi:hypothetical protein
MMLMVNYGWTDCGTVPGLINKGLEGKKIHF